MNEDEHPCTPSKAPPTQLESVLGATPHEFESRILRRFRGPDHESGPALWRSSVSVSVSAGFPTRSDPLRTAPDGSGRLPEIRTVAAV
jgi:hypothetical protein